MSSAQVHWGVCIGLRAGLPSSVFLSEIFEWDQTVIRSKLAQKHTQVLLAVHMCVCRHIYCSIKTGCKWAAREGCVHGNGVAPVNGATPKEASRNSPVL